MNRASLDGRWSLRADGAYTRPCGHYEQLFYWDSVQDGGFDLLEHLSLNVRPDIPMQTVFGRQNVIRAWTHLKCLYPLLGAQVEEQDGNVSFVVFEKDLHTIRPDEIVFGQLSSDEQASSILLEIANAPRALSVRYPSRLHILCHPDIPQRAHVIIQVAHSISDATSQATIKVTLLQLLTKARPFVHNFEDRLALSLASDAFRPVHSESSPRQRWRLAIAAVITQQRRIYGGHTIPRRVTTITHYSSAISRQMFIGLSPDASARIIARCKNIGITFGKIFPLLGQIAATRLLFRHYMRGQISEEEWELRKREPMHFTGSIDIRPMLDKEWYNNGGRTHVCLSITAYTLTLPYMPLGELANVKPSPDLGRKTPPFSSFLNMKRFLLRAQMLRDQFDRFLEHPLFFEKAEISFRNKIQHGRENAIRWREEQAKPEELRHKGKVISVLESSRVPGNLVMTHSGSSWGVVDNRYPTTFPLALKAGEEPVIKVVASSTQMRCRPAALRPGTAAYNGTIYMGVFWDTKVYEEDVVKEYLEEVCGAAEWYLANDGHDRSVPKL